MTPRVPARDRLTRRGFLGAAGVLSAGALVRPAGAAQGAQRAMAHAAGAAREPLGDLADRIASTAGRLGGSGVPAFSEEFVLGDVTLDPERRFTNYSGDLSGRYAEALALLPPSGRAAGDLRPLVRRIIAEQKPDGRFGRTDLRFTAAEIGTDHMPLLWGNGRLLVGLMSYVHATGDQDVLASARRLGDFLLGVQAACGAPEVVQRVELGGAAGFICFTQLNEGLVLLWQSTRDPRCLAAAREMLRLLRPRGVQHSHGYLTTMRGALMVHEATGDAAVLAEVERGVSDLARSADYLVDGGIHEFFGWDDPANAAALGALRKGPDDLGRNEGCSLADLVRLALHLHRVTSKAEYLAIAERGYLNAFSHNQFGTGDFGHRSYFERGFKPVPNLARAWWCCTMHGYRCFADVIEQAVTVDGRTVRVNLFEDLRLGGDAALRTRATGFGVALTFDRAFEGAIALRVPAWADAAYVTRNGERIEAPSEGGALLVSGRFAAKDALQLVVRPRAAVRTRTGELVPLATLGNEPVDGTLEVGPYVMTVTEEDAPDFFGEPWSGGEGGRAHGNIVRLDSASSWVPGRWPRLKAEYDHGGFRGRYPVVLRPLGARPAADQQILAFTLPYGRLER